MFNPSFTTRTTLPTFYKESTISFAQMMD